MTDKEWEETYKKTERKLKKAAKVALIIVIVVFIYIAIFWIAIVYTRDYKITDVTQSLSPDGEYELLLQAVGEADWPFGPADGRLVLTEGDHKVAEAGFTIYDDGKAIGEDSWTVAWYDDCVEVILSGEEQSDEQVVLYYDGSVERGQLSDSQLGTDSEGRTEQYDLPQPYAKYVEVLTQIMEEGIDPNGRGYSVDQNRDKFENNLFAIMDIDMDGRQELIFNFNESYMGAMCEVVYAYDEDSGILREEFSEWVDNTYYSNGFVKASFSHNHGKDPDSRGTWPYALYQYDAETDSYQVQYYVDSWDKYAYSEDFPDELDADGDGLLFYITEKEESVDDADVVLLNQEEYDRWVQETIPEQCKINVTYHSMTEEAIGSIETAYEQALIYAQQADHWQTGEMQYQLSNSYLLYDMDRDGRLELIRNAIQGSGRFSDNYFYNLTDKEEIVELPLVKLWNGRKETGVSDFDIAAWYDTEAYQDTSGVIYYESKDYERDGADGAYYVTGFYYLDDVTVFQDSIRKSSVFIDSETGAEDIHYYEIGDTQVEITEAEYEKIREDYVKDMTQIKVYQNWVYFTEEELSAGLSKEQIGLRLLESFVGSR